MTRRRVFFVTTEMTTGGAECLLVKLIERLESRCYLPEVVCLKELGELGAQLIAQGVPVWVGQARSGQNPLLLGWLVDLMNRRPPAVVCTVGSWGDRSFWGRLAARLAGVPAVVACPHSMGPPDRFELCNRLLTGWTDRFVAVARCHKEYLVRQCGLPASKVQVIYNGVDLERFTPGPAPDGLRAQFSIAPGTPVAGTVSMLRPEKNVALFLEAARLVQVQIPTAQFLVVGDGPERDRLVSLAQRLGIARSLHFAGLSSDVQPMMRLLDVFVLSSLSEAFPLSVLEAHACSKPVVATDVGAVRELVTPGETGCLVSSGRAEELAASITRLLANPQLAKRMGRLGRNRAQRRFGLDAMVEGYTELFDRLLQEKIWLNRKNLQRQTSEVSETSEVCMRVFRNFSKTVW